MKKNVTYVARSEFETILSHLGMPTKVQSGFIRVEGPKGNRLYVAATKKVGRIDISGFEVGSSGVTPHCGVFGNVKQQMDMSGTEAEVLERFKVIIGLLLSQPEKVKEVKTKAPRAPRGKKEKKGWGAKAVPVAQPISARLAAIQAYAEKNGLSVSAKTLAACQAGQSFPDALASASK